MLVISSNVAVMLVNPSFRAITMPGFAESSIVATITLLELQLAKLVISCIELSSYVPVAANCCTLLSFVLDLFKVTAIDCNPAILSLNVGWENSLAFRRTL